MLSTKECRALIDGGEKYTEKEIEDIRSALYEMARIALDAMREEKSK